MIEVRLPDGVCVCVSPGRVADILSSLEVNPYEFLAMCEGELLLADDVVEDGSVVVLTSIVHGG